MIDNHAVTLEKHRPRQNHHPAIDGVDLGSRWSGKVQALVPALNLVVEHSRGPEYVGDRIRNRRHELADPKPVRCDGPKYLSFQAFVGGDGGELIGTGFSKFFSDFDCDLGISSVADSNFSGQLYGSAARQRFRDPQFVGSCFCGQWDGRESVPFFIRS